MFAMGLSARSGEAQAWAAKEDAKGVRVLRENTRDAAAVQDRSAKVVEGASFWNRRRPHQACRRRLLSANNLAGYETAQA